MTPAVRSLLASLVAAACLAAQEVPVEAPQGDPAGRYRTAVWLKDFPVALEFPTPRGNPTYDRTRRRALEQVVDNLRGNNRREVWLMATEFFHRAPAEAVEPLIAAMDRHAQVPAYSDVVQNIVEAMGRMGDERFDEALRRALEHPNPAVKQAAYAALGTAGKAETVRATFPFFLQMDGRARASWLRAARLKLGEGAVAPFRQLMEVDLPVQVRDMVLKETLELPPAQGARVLEPVWEIAQADFRMVIAGVFHAAGDVRGTTHLREAMASENPVVVAAAVAQAGKVDPGVLRDDVLRLSTHLRPEVRLAVAGVAARMQGEDATGALETFAAPDEAWEVRSVAIRALTARGNTRVTDVLLEEVGTATGTRLQRILDLLSASGDDRASALFAARFRLAPAGEGRPFLQALAFSRARTAFDSLAELFTEDVRPVSDPERVGGQLNTVNYVPTLMLNLRDSGSQLAAFWRTLPREDVVRRAVLLPTVSGLAAEQVDPANRKVLEDLLRDILLDREEHPQLRILALNVMQQKVVTLDDAFRIKQSIPDESPEMQRFFGDWLNEFF